MRSHQDFIFSTRIQDGIPRDNQKGRNGKYLAGGKTLATFYWILWGRIRTSLFPSGSRMGSQGTTKRTKRKMSDGWEKTLATFYWILWGRIWTSLFSSGSRMGSQEAAKGTNNKLPDRRENPSDFWLDFMLLWGLGCSICLFDVNSGVLCMRALSALLTTCAALIIVVVCCRKNEVASGPHFFHQDPGWDLKGQPKNQKGQCLAGGKTLATFYWIIWGRIRTPLFPSGSRMGSQGTAKGTKRKTPDKRKKSRDFFWIWWSRIRTSFFPSGSRMGSQGTAKETKMKMSGRWNNP